MDSVECDETNTVLGPAAYLVDLLQFLRTCKGNDQDLFKIFKERRSDILALQLSKPNTLNMVHYIDLANEAMESWIRKDAGNSEIVSFNESEDSSSNFGLHVDWNLYEKKIQDTVFPVSLFPYNHATTTIRETFKAMKASWFDCLHACKLDKIGGNEGHLDVALFQDAQDRRLASEILNLQLEDYVAITKEGYHSHEYCRILSPAKAFSSDAYQNLIGLKGVSQYWGYIGNSDGKKQINDVTNGLCLVRDSLLVRLGVDLKQLLSLLQTSYIGGRLVIESVDEHGKYSDAYKDMRLRSSPMMHLDGKLSLDIVDDLQRFVRLLKRVQWPIETLDAAVVTFNTLILSGGQPRSEILINPEIIDCLAAVLQLSKLTDIGIEKLLPLWGNIKVCGASCLYNQLFSRPQFTQYAATLLMKANASAKFSDNMSPMLSAFQINSKPIASLLANLGLSKDSLWTVENISSVYRANILCKILGVPVDSYGKLKKLFAKDNDLLRHPRSTLEFVTEWKALNTMEITVPGLLTGEAEDRKARDRAATILLKLIEKVAAIDERFRSLENDLAMESPSELTITEERVLEILTIRNSLEASTAVADMVDGTPKLQSRITPKIEKIKASEQTHPGVIIPEILQEKLKYDDLASTISLYGVLTEDELQAAKLLHSSTQWTIALVATQKKAVEYNLHQTQVLGKLSVSQDTYLWQPASSSTEPNSGNTAILRRKAFLQKYIPETKDVLKKSAIVETLAMECSNVGPGNAILPKLVNEVLKSPDGVLGIKVFKDLIAPKLQQSPPAGKQPPTVKQPTGFDICIFPRSETTCQLTISGEIGNVSLASGDQILQILNSEKKDIPQTSTDIKLKPGVSYRLHSTTIPLSKITWISNDPAKPVVKFDQCESQKFEVAISLINSLQNALDIIQASGLQDEEAIFFLGTNLDFVDPSFSDLKRLRVYKSTKDMFSSNLGNSRKLLDFMIYCKVRSQAVSYRSELGHDLITMISSITGATKDDVSQILSLKYGTKDELVIIKGVNTENFLSGLKSVIDLVERLGLSISTIYEWTTLRQPGDIHSDFDLASKVQTTLSSAVGNIVYEANNVLRLNQQAVLVGYLLQNAKIKALHITRADHLFEYFLIDVSMGPAMKTSRIKQAIATIQLFVQRCLLGLEKKFSVPTTTIDQVQWNWMGRMSMWVANRKVLLYPENWVEPTLRTNKSAPFKALEAEILQSKLDKKSIAKLLRTYIYNVHEIADLEVQSYIWESTNKFRGNYHLFGRTRTAPFTFYYRRLQVSGPNSAAAEYDWHPWVKMDLDIPAIQSNKEGNSLSCPGTYLIPALLNKRLYVFIPSVDVKRTPKLPDKSLTFSSISATPIRSLDMTTSYEIKMGWTEFRNGAWTSKKISQTFITVKDTQVTLPDVPDLKFWVRSDKGTVDTNPSMMVIDVEYSFKVEKELKKGWLGRFEWKGEQLIACSSTPSEKTVSLSSALTKFSKIEHTTKTTSLAELKKELAAYQEKTTDSMQPLLSTPPVDGKQKDSTMKWTLCFNEYLDYRATGLIVERTSQFQVESFFVFPDITKDGDLDSKSEIATSAQSLSHAESPGLVQAATSTSEEIETLFKTLETVSKDNKGDAFGETFAGLYKEMGTPNSIYNWELGFHSVLMLMERLFANQQFELGCEIGRLVFDPTADGSDGNNGQDSQPISQLQRCWRFTPFKSPEIRQGGSISNIIYSLAAGLGNSKHISSWIANPFDPHAVARSRPAVYMKRFVIKYIEALVAQGDIFFRGNSLETIPMAIQRYTEALQLFGPPHQITTRKTKRSMETYLTMEDFLNDFSSANVSMELQFPFFDFAGYGNAPEKKRELPSNSIPSFGLVYSPYFYVPPNPQISALRDLIDDRLYKIRNSLDINGNFQSYAIFEPAIDPSVLISAQQGSEAAARYLQDRDGPMPNYRFQYLLQKAFELCNELKAYSDSYLSIKEKQDAEELSRLHATQEAQIQKLQLGMKKLQKEEAMKSLETMKDTRSAHAARLKFYLDVTGDTKAIPGSNDKWEDIVQSFGKITPDDLRMSEQEDLDMTKSFYASKMSQLATDIDNTCSVLAMIPKLTTQVQPMGCGVSTQIDATLAIAGLGFTASVLRAGSQIASDEANRASKKAQLIRQLQDRRLQANMAARDLKNMDKQIEGQMVRIAICDAEINTQNEMIDNSAQVSEFMRSKYTNKELYGWMDKFVRDLSYQTYVIAIDTARKAEKAFLYERGPSAGTTLLGKFLQPSYWDDGRDGAFAAQRLSLDLRKLEVEYTRKSSHDYEMVKHISLRQIDPWALLRLQLTGAANFEVPEVLFDLDFPGHYCRRIKTVSVTLPCITGPYTNMGCSLKLLEHRYRLSMNAPGASYYPDIPEADPRFTSDKVPITAVAVSSGRDDSGVFELNLRDERWIPFEGAGALSKWRIELPPNAMYDYTTISDVVIQMRYTALEGGGAWRKVAGDAVKNFMNGADGRENDGQMILFDLKNEIPDYWQSLIKSTDSTIEVPLTKLESLMPFWTKSTTPKIMKAWFLINKGTSSWTLSKQTPVKVFGAEMKTSSEQLGDMTILETADSLGRDFKDQALSFTKGGPEKLQFERGWLLLRYNA
ncbi:hypothetical protein ABW20_dc0104619 [Dactylellina cionopaga]|nr:hypothetical protein ABW20_dc0104619 [Dactylellina cionopaga]